jgi:hypothetical protein
MGKNQDPGSGSGINILDHISESLKTINSLMRMRIRNFVEPGSGSGIAKIGSRINIPDPQHYLEDGSGFCGVFILFIQICSNDLCFSFICAPL